MTSHPTSQDAFKYMIKTFYAPRLREMGFRGSGKAFYKEDGVWLYCVGFQGSSRNSFRVSFYRLSVEKINKEDWENLKSTNSFKLPKYPTPGTHYSVPAMGAAVSEKVLWRDILSRLLQKSLGKYHLRLILPLYMRGYRLSYAGWYKITRRTNTQRLAKKLLLRTKQGLDIIA